MIYHIITPFKRFQHIVPLSTMLYYATMEKLVWHPIFDDDVKFNIAPTFWIQPMVCPGTVDGWYMGHFKENWFIEHAPIVDQDRYLVLNDDDAYGTDFFKKIDAVQGDCLICSMRRNASGDVLVAALRTSPSASSAASKSSSPEPSSSSSAGAKITPATGISSRLSPTNTRPCLCLTPKCSGTTTNRAVGE